MEEPAKFRSYEEFFEFYLREHSDPRNRWMHVIGMVLGAAVAVAAVVTHHPWYALFAYGFSFAGHFLIEKNKPATFGHPFWSFISDFRMLWLMLTRRHAIRVQAHRNSPN